jgi:hypothetical protein
MMHALLLAMATASASAASVVGPHQRALQSSGQEYSPTCKGKTNWMILLYVLGPLYALVMAFTIYAICCRDRRANRNNEMNASALESGYGRSGGESEGKGWFRKVNRPRSAWQASRTGRAGGGINLDQIDRQIRMAFLRKVYAILSTQLLVTMVIVLAFIVASFEEFDPAQPTEFFYGIYNNSWVRRLNSQRNTLAPMRPHQARPSAAHPTPWPVPASPPQVVLPLRSPSHARAPPPSTGCAGRLDPADRPHLRIAMREEFLPMELHCPLPFHLRRGLRARHHLLNLLWRLLRRPDHHGISSPLPFPRP